MFRHAWRAVSRWRKSLAMFVVLLVGMGVGAYQLLKSDSDIREQARIDFHNEAFQVADQLRRQVRTSVSSMYALASMIEVDGGRFLEQHFEPIASTILERYRGISNFDIAPFAVVKTKVPLAGNEGAIGHAMLSDPRRIEATLATIREGRALLDGPLRLLQGGTAVIARYPVFTRFSPEFIPDIYSWWPDWSHSCCSTSIPLPGYGADSLPGGPDESGNRTYFYGLVEFVSKIEKLTEDLDLESVAQRMSFQFRNKNPHPSMSDTPVFLASPDLEPGAVLGNPVAIPISLPDIRIEWEFLAVPVGGWLGPSVVVIVLAVGVSGGLLIAGLIYVLVWRLLSMRASSQLLEMKLQNLRLEIVAKACSAVEELASPMALVSAELFMGLGRFISFEELRNTGQLIVLDTRSQVQRFRESRWIIFFSHQWLGYSAPDEGNLHYSTMCSVLPSILVALPPKDGQADLQSAFVWVDYQSIPQVNSSMQALTINSLPLYAAEADVFVMIVPETQHSNTKLTCNLDTYSQRGWCRAEILCKVCAGGLDSIYIARDAFNLEPLNIQRFKELSIMVFGGSFTCCALHHPNGAMCDKKKLMAPILGMYMSLVEAMDGAADSAAGSAKAEVFEYIMENRELFFPHSVDYQTNGVEGVTQELFGDVVRGDSMHLIRAEMSRQSSTVSRSFNSQCSLTSTQSDLAVPTAAHWQQTVTRDIMMLQSVRRESI